MTAIAPPGQRATTVGRAVYGSVWRPALAADAPGRLELLGNHVDYNGGLVIAGAIDRVVSIVADDGSTPRLIELVAGDMSSDIDTLDIEASRDWTTRSPQIGPGEYARGVVAALLADDHAIRSGLRLSIAGDVPIGFGISSSAALCVALVLILANESLPDRVVVAMAREAEHRCGSPVGAMDQSASVAGGVILFDGRDASYTTIEPDLGDYVFAVADSGVSHALGSSSYPVRVAESREALDVLQGSGLADLPSLGELDPAQWAAASERLGSELASHLRDRVDHVVSEVARVRLGMRAVEASDWKAFGQLMTASGRSSAETYRVSHPKVEELVAELVRMDGVSGARMMGGGDGGPALALIHRDAVAAVSESLGRGFFARNPSHLAGDRLQVCSFGPGARLIQP